MHLAYKRINKTYMKVVQILKASFQSIKRRPTLCKESMSRVKMIWEKVCLMLIKRMNFQNNKQKPHLNS